MFFIICQGCAQNPAEINVIRKPVTPGAWLTEEYLPLLEGKAVGLVINHTSLIGEQHLLDSLLNLGVAIKKIFAPEHGIRGQADAGATIADEKDIKTGLPVISLYGKKKKPASTDLADIDVLMFDIQDVGVRFYTYISTLHYILEAAAENNIPLIVLDRPNPNGHYIDGPILDTAGYRSFVGMHPIPVVYGMTIGELAQMINGENWINRECSLTVIPCRNYTHDSMYELPVRPSPNLPNLRSVLLYPGLCFFEGTDVSIGRGTAFPFQVAGHPDYPDKSFSFTPVSMPGATHPPQEGNTCYGIDLRQTDIDSLFSNRQMDISVLLQFHQKLPVSQFFNSSWFDKLAGGPSFRQSIASGLTENEIRQQWQPDLERFKKKRAHYLLYPDAANCLPK